MQAQLHFLSVHIAIAAAFLTENILNSPELSAQTIAPDFAGPYVIRNLGAAGNVPSAYGGMTFKAGDPNTFLIGGEANGGSAQIYALTVQRGGDGHITGFSSAATVFAEASGSKGGGIDGGLDYGPNGVLFYTTYDDNTLGQLRPGNRVANKKIVLDDLGIAPSVGALAFVPEGFPGAGRLKITSFSGSTWYDTSISPDGTGTFDIASPSHSVSFEDRPEGIFFVKAGSPKFLNNSVLIGFYSRDLVRAYEMDANGDPIIGTGRDFITGLNGITGATRDPVTGDFLFSSFNDPHIYVVGGFSAAATQVNITSPLDNSTFIAAASFDLEATATQQGGSIDRVVYYQNQAALESSQTPPYRVAVSGLRAGNYSYYAVAYDGAGGATTSAVVHVTVTSAPIRVTLVSPAGSTEVPACARMLLSVDVSGGAASMANVAFYDGTQTIAQIRSAPYQHLLAHLTEGTYSFWAKATDNQGVSVATPPATVVVRPLPTNILAIHHLAPAELEFCFKGQPSSNYIWETAATPEGPWQGYATNVAPQGLWQLTNAFPVNLPAAFYRTKRVP